LVLNRFTFIDGEQQPSIKSKKELDDINFFRFNSILSISKNQRQQ
jgi:hypothetical protein